MLSGRKFTLPAHVLADIGFTSKLLSQLVKFVSFFHIWA